MSTRTVNDIWAPLGEQKWRDLAEGSNATELQLKFAACRFGGMNASAAAKTAGYSGDADAIRRAGYSALRSTAVQALLELAAINAPLDAKISEKEIDAKLARLIRSGDPLTMLKAAELHQKRQAIRAAELEAKEDDRDYRIERTELAGRLVCGAPAGLGAAMCLAFDFQISGEILNFPFLKEVAPVVSKKFPDDWQRWRSSSRSPQELDEAAAGPLLEGDALIEAIEKKCPRVLNHISRRVVTHAA